MSTLDPAMAALSARTAAAWRAEHSDAPDVASAPHPALADRAINVTAIISTMRGACRDELIHYAGAAGRDLVAWHVCDQYLHDPRASESELKSRALKAAYGWDVPPEIDTGTL